MRVLNASERKVRGKKGTESTHRFYAETNVTITDDHEIDFKGETYEVLFVESPRNHHLEIDAWLVR